MRYKLLVTKKNNELFDLGYVNAETSSKNKTTIITEKGIYEIEKNEDEVNYLLFNDEKLELKKVERLFQ